jgi:hypothetical protein
VDIYIYFDINENSCKGKGFGAASAFVSLKAYDGNYSAASDIFAVGVIGYRLEAKSENQSITNEQIVTALL